MSDFERAVAVLRRVEWHQQMWNGVAECPYCHGYRPSGLDDDDPKIGHSVSCELAMLLIAERD